MADENLEYTRFEQRLLLIQEQIDVVRHQLNTAALALQGADAGGDDEHQTLFHAELQAFGAVAVPSSSSAAAVRRRSLQKQTFRSGGKENGILTECSICLEEFVDGVQVSVMPCGRAHLEAAGTGSTRTGLHRQVAADQRHVPSLPP